MSKHFPLFIDLTNKNVVVIGAGTIATRRIRTLLEFTGHLTVVAPEATDEVASLADRGLLCLHRAEYTPDVLNDAYLVIAATNDPDLNDSIYRTCKQRNILVNTASDKEKCDFYFPGIITKENIVVGVTASGENHTLAKEITKKIREVL